MKKAVRNIEGPFAQDSRRNIYERDGCLLLFLSIVRTNSGRKYLLFLKSTHHNLSFITFIDLDLPQTGVLIHAKCEYFASKLIKTRFR